MEEAGAAAVSQAAAGSSDDEELVLLPSSPGAGAAPPPAARDKRTVRVESLALRQYADIILALIAALPMWVLLMVISIYIFIRGLSL